MLMIFCFYCVERRRRRGSTLTKLRKGKERKGKGKGKERKGQGKARQGIDISFPPSLETREDPSFQHRQVALTFLNLTDQEDINELKKCSQLVVPLRHLYKSPITTLSYCCSPSKMGEVFKMRSNRGRINHQSEKLQKAQVQRPTKNDKSGLRAAQNSLTTLLSITSQPFQGERDFRTV